ncbi:hypothetical protein Syun_023226 [Stephania yunnanensis]|uniref:Uncharacterized protein n=1 Tax=Stephania yunnanensis TaxID=152371 RepID=A0AAP0F8K1_9MAGN
MLAKEADDQATTEATTTKFVEEMSNEGYNEKEDDQHGFAKGYNFIDCLIGDHDLDDSEISPLPPPPPQAPTPPLKDLTP